jgi:MFS family permease
LDELASGIAPASAPDIASSLGVSGGAAAAAVIVAFHSLALFVETPLLAWSERVSARWFSAGSLVVVALSAFGAAAFPQGWVFFVSLATYGPASGCALAVAEGMLVEANPEARERTMARLSLAANAGDLAVPLLLALLAWCGFGWQAGCTAAGVCALLLAVAHAGARVLDRAVPSRTVGVLFSTPTFVDGTSGSDSSNTREALQAAFARRPLLGWSLACALTGLLDEVLVAFSAIHLHAIGATVNERSWALAAWVIGGFIGVGSLERFAGRVPSRRLLTVASAATALATVALASTQSPRLATVALFLVGVAGSALHPLAKARAYAALPGRPAIVNAVGSALLLLDMAAPIALGIVATEVGSAWAIAALLVAPIGVVTASRCFDA